MAPKVLVVLTSQNEIPSLKKPTGWYLVSINRQLFPHPHHQTPVTATRIADDQLYHQHPARKKLYQLTNPVSPNSPTPTRSSTKRPSSPSPPPRAARPRSTRPRWKCSSPTQPRRPSSTNKRRCGATRTNWPTCCPARASSMRCSTSVAMDVCFFRIKQYLYTLDRRS